MSEAGATPPVTITPYERLRLAKIARNNARLEELGLGSGGIGSVGATNSKRRRGGGGGSVVVGEGSNSKRWSTSKRGGRDGGDDDERPAPRRNPRRRSRERGADKHSGPTVRVEGGEASRTTTASLDAATVTPESERRAVDDQMIREAAALGAVADSVLRFREALHATMDDERIMIPEKGKGDVEVDEDDRFYRTKSLALWGPACSPPPSYSWRTFYESRTARGRRTLGLKREIPPTSPYNLLQETYASLSSWHLICSCILMSRVRSAEVKIRCITGFFDLCPTPSDFAHLDPARLMETIHSLGFQAERASHLVAATEAFLTRGKFTMDNVPVEKGGNKIAGCGPFAVDSYHVFFKLDVDYEMGSDDVRVRSYQRWLKRWREDHDHDHDHDGGKP